MSNQIISDDELVQRYIQGDELALKTLIERHESRIFTSIYLLVKNKYLAEDIFQETFIKVIKALRKGHYEESGKFQPWVMRIAKNLVLDHFRKQARMPQITDTEGNEIMTTLRFADESTEDQIIRSEEETMVKALIQNLPEEQREVLILRHYAGLSFKEISELTGQNVNTALGRMRYALINLRKLIEKNNIML